jgi:hypothetical protein
MKTIFKSGFIAMAITIVISGCGSSSALSQSELSGTITYQTFYDNLSPYGTWIDYPNYGHVWNPRIDGDFRPYATNGHWVSSAEGWAWASDYNWGWAPFHYGRWLYDDMYGWLWIPGYDWSPAWVTWGSVDNFYCWAPLMPGIDVSMQFGSWRPHSFYWNACSRDRIYDRNLYGVMENQSRFATNVNRITVINNFNTTKTHNLYYAKGPDVHDVQKYVHQNIQQTPIRDVSKISQVRHDKNTMNVYRPAIEDPKETVQHHPQQILQPHEFRKAVAEQARPISKEEQKPFMARSEQKNNVQRLMVQHSGAGYKGNNGHDGGHRGRK